jgi:hypothetical protein
MGSDSKLIANDNLLSELHAYRSSDVSDESTKTEALDTDFATTSSGEWSQPCPAFLGDSEVGSIDEGKSFSFLISIHWNDESDGM